MNWISKRSTSDQSAPHEVQDFVSIDQLHRPHLRSPVSYISDIVLSPLDILRCNTSAACWKVTQPFPCISRTNHATQRQPWSLCYSVAEYQIIVKRVSRDKDRKHSPCHPLPKQSWTRAVHVPVNVVGLECQAIKALPENKEDYHSAKRTALSGFEPNW